MKAPSPILNALARRYERSQAGRTGEASRDLLVDIEELLLDAGSSEGERRELAERQLREMQAQGILQLDPAHKRDPSRIHQVRLSPTGETKLYEYLGRTPPNELRRAVATQFEVAMSTAVPLRWREAWRTWCERMREVALGGGALAPFDREPTPANKELLTLVAKLLSWEGESLVRFASCVLCGNSKMLEVMAAKEREGDLTDQLRGKLGRLLEDITGGAVKTLDDLGIVPNPRSVLAHGPLRLRLDGESLDLGKLRSAFRISQVDVERAEAVETAARRCLTIENETSFHELAKLNSGELLIQTSYPGSGTLALLRRLPATMESWHFGDSDVAGFDILRVLREKSGRSFQPLHMQSGRVPFEQESLGRPTCASWPFYT